MKTRLLAASAILAAVLLPVPFAVTAQAACDPSTRAIQYLAANQLADGSLDMSSAGGFGNPTATENFVLAAAAAGYDPTTLNKGGKTPFDYLAASPGFSTSNAGRAARLVLALAAGNTTPGRYDYNNFGGTHPLDVIASGYQASGSSAGAYDTGLAFPQALAILALKAAGQTPPAAAVTWLQHVRNTGRAPSSGGYAGELPTDTGWSSGNAADQSQGDTNTTAEAIQALAAVGDHSQDSAALAFLHTQQNPDGGFPLQSPSLYGTSSDPDSDALVLQGLAAATGGKGLSAWTVAGHTPLSNQLSMQDQASGGYGFPGSPSDTFTTSQAPQGTLQWNGLVVAPPAGQAIPAGTCSEGAVAAAGTGPSPTPAPALPRAGRAVADPPPPVTASIPLVTGVLLVVSVLLLGASAVKPGRQRRAGATEG